VCVQGRVIARGQRRSGILTAKNVATTLKQL
jgi:hypothetical protein